MIRRFLPDDSATGALAQALAATQPSPAVVYLHGDLGAGKSTLARAWLRALGVTGPVRSPTYTLVERYPLSTGAEAVHLDLYRIGEAGELEFLGLDGIEPALWLVEWPERGRGALPLADLEIALEVSGNGREVRLLPGGRRASDWLAALERSGRLGAFPEPNP